MGKKVLKFGGTSVGTIERIQHVANIIKKEQSLGNKVIVIDKGQIIQQGSNSDLKNQDG